MGRTRTSKAYIEGPSSLSLAPALIRGWAGSRELRFFRTRLQHIAAWVAEANARLGSADPGLRRSSAASRAFAA